LEIKLFEGKIVLVTGGTSGIGRATAVAFGKEGATVVIAARRENLGAEVAAEITDGGSEALFVRTDVRKPEDIDHLSDVILEKYGRLDITFNNAGTSLPHIPLVAKTTLEEWDTVIETNMRGIWLCMKYEIPLQRLGRPEEISGAVLWLCSDAASFMTGKEMAIGGGHGIKP